jgi:biopolymer transport protein ExbB/TolQ
MQKRNKIINVFLILVYTSLFQSVFSYLTQFNATELVTYNKFLNRTEQLNIKIKKYEKAMKNIKFNFKLKNRFRHIKKENSELFKKIKQIKKEVNGTEFDKNKIAKDLILLTNNYNQLIRKFLKFDFKYKSYEKFKSEIYDYIKIFFICFFSVVLILLIILVVVAVIMYRKRPKYSTLHEEVSIKQEIKSVPINNIVDEKSEERNINRDNNSDIPESNKKEIKP